MLVLFFCCVAVFIEFSFIYFIEKKGLRTKLKKKTQKKINNFLFKKTKDILKNGGSTDALAQAVKG